MVFLSPPPTRDLCIDISRFLQMIRKTHIFGLLYIEELCPRRIVKQS